MIIFTSEILEYFYIQNGNSKGGDELTIFIGESIISINFNKKTQNIEYEFEYECPLCIINEYYDGDAGHIVEFGELDVNNKFTLWNCNKKYTIDIDKLSVCEFCHEEIRIEEKERAIALEKEGLK